MQCSTSVDWLLIFAQKSAQLLYYGRGPCFIWISWQYFMKNWNEAHCFICKKTGNPNSERDYRQSGWRSALFLIQFHVWSHFFNIANITISLNSTISNGVGESVYDILCKISCVRCPEFLECFTRGRMLCYHYHEVLYELSLWLKEKQEVSWRSPACAGGYDFNK